MFFGMLWALICVFFIHQVRGFWDPTLTLISQWGQLEEPPRESRLRCLSAYHSPEKIEFARVLNTGQ
uniref:Secreted protein n=1 Tax=Strigamia maritima TaxID=126957 RepID=T1JK79_STRMM